MFIVVPAQCVDTHCTALPLIENCTVALDEKCFNKPYLRRQTRFFLMSDCYFLMSDYFNSRLFLQRSVERVSLVSREWNNYYKGTSLKHREGSQHCLDVEKVSKKDFLF